ncbi:Macrolide export ATP-binding/permease protein MacB {ECO:0000255/HAMAP-Rule:MF_01720} [Oenococcus sicerae]|nr:Macrolide export ATP-binding/permease protein MacB {ECO:0000255/HAMAP-Rule:MF_01720} [Oenococcus sicerae]
MMIKQSSMIFLTNLKALLLQLLKVQAGEGKTTLLDILGLLIEADNGSYLVDDQSMLQLKPRKLRDYYRKYFGFVFQDYGLILNETVAANLKIATRFLRLTRKQKYLLMLESLNKVGLNDSYYQMPAYKLSGGEQQRVALARLLLKKAEIILADEPTGSLDLQNGYQVMNILKSFAEHGSIVVMVTHSNQFDNYFDQIINI